jgi:acetolactate synthase I/II/III large subunit
MSEHSTADVIAAHLVAAGVPRMFGYPGDSNIELMEAARAAGVPTVLASREGTATFMAQGHAMATGGLGVVTSTLGPGSSSLVNGVLNANLDRVPLLALSGQIDAARETYFTHQVVDHTLMFAPVTKHAGRIVPGAAATAIRRAIRLATAERPGAVHLTLNADHAKAAASDHEVHPVPVEPAMETVAVHRASGAPDPLELLRRARRPVIIAGTGAVRQRAAAALTTLAETGGIPVITAAMAKGVLAEDHPSFAGVIEMACNDLIEGFLDRADLILTVGLDASELFGVWRRPVPVLHIDTVANIDQVWPAAVELIGSIPAALTWLTEALDGAPRFSAAEIAAHRAQLHDGLHAQRSTTRLNPSDVMDVVRAAMPRDTLATSDVGSHKLLVGQMWTTYAPRETLMANGLSSMGFGLPAAIGAKLALPDTPVLAAVGDGGFLMVQGELAMAAARGLGMVVLVFSDQSLNRIEIKQEKLGYPSTATRIEQTDLPALAEAMGCDGVRATDIPSLERALEGAATLTRPLVVEAVIDPSQYSAQFS